MNRALWSLGWRQAGTPLLATAFLLFAFQWLFVWMSSYFDMGWLGTFMKFGIPDALRRLIPLAPDKAASPVGFIALAYNDPVVLFTATFWAISRGSDSVSGPLDRGTMELLLAQPVSRPAVLLSQACVTVAGAAVLAFGGWLGAAIGLLTVDLGEEISPVLYLPAAANLFFFTFFLCGLTTFVSSCDRYRSRTIGLVGGIFVVQLIFKVVARMAPPVDWLNYLTFFGAYEPTSFIDKPEQVWSLSLRYDGVLLGLGLACYVAALLVFRRRDLPAPL